MAKVIVINGCNMLSLWKLANKDTAMNEEPNIQSPCVGLCELDEANQYCLGCGRSLDEIAAWSSASDEEKWLILNRLPGV